ncbi:hypothetical protein D3C80_1431560 [compost metagenome]
MLPALVPAGIVAVIGDAVPLPMTTGAVKLPDASERSTAYVVVVAALVLKDTWNVFAPALQKDESLLVTLVICVVGTMVVPVMRILSKRELPAGATWVPGDTLFSEVVDILMYAVATLFNAAGRVKLL